MKRSWMIIVVLIFTWQNVSAQAMHRWKIPALFGPDLTIRERNANDVVGYGTNSNGEGCFFLQSASPSTVMTATLPRGYMVTDFRILHDTVFFCGVNNNTNRGIVGLFDINAIFPSGGSPGIIHLVDLNTSLSSHIINTRRMDVFTFRGVTHIAFVGDVESTASGLSMVSSTVGDAYWDGTDWYFDCYQNPSADLTYTDVAASSDYIMVTAKKNSSQYFAVQVFKVSYDMLATELTPNNVFQMSWGTPMDDIVVEDISSTDFALAYHYAIGGTAGTEVQLLHVDPVLPTVYVTNTLRTPHGSGAIYAPTWIVKHLCYDAASQMLLLLHDVSSTVAPTVESTVSKYDVANITSGMVDLSYIPSVQMKKMEASVTGGYRLIGMDNNMLTTTKETYLHLVLCRKEYQMNTVLITDALMDMLYMGNRIGQQRNSDVTQIPTIGWKLLELYCEEQP